VSISEGHVVLAVLLLHGQTLSTKEGYGLGANDSDPNCRATCILVTSMNAVSYSLYAPCHLLPRISPSLLLLPHTVVLNINPGVNNNKLTFRGWK
jgi:hypothetical protein